LNNANGQKLQLATGKTATITIPIPSAMQAAAPATISLWYFDETKGIWKEEGNATKQTTNYVGTVSHFSFWNAGEPGADIQLEATFKDSLGLTALTNKLVTITSANFGTTKEYTGDNGKLSGLVPANETLVMNVFDDCGVVNYTKSIGPFSTNTDLGNINVFISNCYPTVTVAGFTYTAPGNIVPVLVTFSNTSTQATNYVWDFGDGGTSTYMNPNHFYTSGGDYTVKLIATGNGVSDSTFKILHLSAGDAYINLTLNGIDYSWTSSNYLLRGQRSYDTGSNSYTLISSDTLPVGFPKFRLSLTIHHDNASAGNIPPGNYPCSVYTVINDTAYSTYLTNLATNVTQYESAGGYITGSSTGWIKYNQNGLPTTDSFPFTCTYRVVRIN
jgi:PKD repeat protein